MNYRYHIWVVRRLAIPFLNSSNKKCHSQAMVLLLQNEEIIGIIVKLTECSIPGSKLHWFVQNKMFKPKLTNTPFLTKRRKMK